jgi:hypothetical protein
VATPAAQVEVVAVAVYVTGEVTVLLAAGAVTLTPVEPEEATVMGTLV